TSPVNSGAQTLAAHGALAPALKDRNERLGTDGERACLVVDHVEVAMDVEASQASALEPMGLDLPARRVDRHKRDAEAGHHGLLDSFRVIEPQHPADLDTSVLERTLGDLARR